MHALSALSLSARSASQRSASLGNLFAAQAKLDQEEQSQSILERFRLHVKFVMASSWGGQLYRNIFLLLSAVSCFFFIAQTYYKYEDYLSSRGKVSTVQ
jgi:hypothetical protein